MGNDELQALRLIRTREIRASAADRADVLKYAGAISQILQLGYREQNVPHAHARVATDTCLVDAAMSGGLGLDG